MSIFGIGKQLLEKHPELIKVSSIVFNYVALNRIKVRGTNRITNNNGFLKRTSFKVDGSNNEIVLGIKSYLNKCTISIVGNNNKIVIGDNTVIHEGSLCIEDDGGEIIIGNGSLLCGPTHLAAIEGTKISIGDACLFSSETVIRTGDSHSIFDSIGNRVNYSKNVVIEDRVWIGYRAMITKGGKVSTDSVVSTGAIVTSAFDDSNVILGGIPARIIKTGITWDKVRIKKSEDERKR